MAQGGYQLDYHILQDLKQRFPEIPEGVVSHYLQQVDLTPPPHPNPLPKHTHTI